MGALCLVLVLLCITLVSFLVCNYLEEERAGCFTLIVFLMSCDCWYSVDSSSQCRGFVCSNCAVLFTDHTHLLIATIYPATVLCYSIMQRLVSMPDKWFYAAGKWFYAAGSYRL